MRRLTLLALLPLTVPLCAPTFALAQTTTPPLLTGAAAFAGWQADSPGTRRLITTQDLPAPYGTRSASNTPSVVPQPPGAAPRVPPGFSVGRFATGLTGPRLIRTAPNGDLFIAESQPGRIRILRAPDGAAAPERDEVFATGLDLPFGIAFYPPGPDPRYVYVATLNTVLRYPYRNGDLHAAAPPEVVIPQLTPPGGYHVTRDIQFSPDGARMFVSIGSGSNDAEGMSRKSAPEIAAWDAQHGPGAAWGSETNRADVLAFTPDGRRPTSYATGLRNCVGLAVQPGPGPAAGTLWCATNERDGLGDNVPPDYVTRVGEHGFYGWPWYYTGNHEDPRHPGERPDLAARTLTPDVLIQPHSAPLEMAFYPPGQTGPAAFPADYAGDAFVALHGSWNRAKRTGYKLVRIRLQNGVPTGEYDDFLTGFVLPSDDVWARPVGVTVAHDGALLFTDDGNGTVWRIAYTGAHTQAAG